MSEFLSREELLKPASPYFEDVPLPAPFEGRKVRIRLMTEWERRQFGMKFLDDDGEIVLERAGEANCRLVQETAVDAQGNRLLGPHDIEALGGQYTSVVTCIADASMRLNRIGKYEGVQAARKNLKSPQNSSGQSDTSPSESADAPTGSAA